MIFINAFLFRSLLGLPGASKCSKAACRHKRPKLCIIRELRGQSSDLWSQLAEEGQLVVTNHGKPVAILSSVGDDNLEEMLQALRRSLAAAAVDSLQRHSVERGLHDLTPAEVENEIRLVRKRRRS